MTTPSLSTVSDMVEYWDARLRQSWDGTTPCYAYSREVLVNNWERLTAAMGGAIRVLVSVKANPHPELIRSLMGVSASFDTASIAEVESVRNCGADGRTAFVSVVGPGKTANHFEVYARAGVDQVVIESGDELTQLAPFLNEGWAPTVLLRVNPGSTASRANEVMGGRASQFGIDEELVPQAVSVASDLGIDIAGLHYFLGSQLHSTSDIIDNFRVARDTTLRLTEACAVRPGVVSLGGGFGVPNTIDDDVVDLDELGDAAAGLIRDIAESTGISVEGQMEAGRYLFATAGVYLCRVLEAKISRGKQFVIVDSGVSGFSRPAVRWGENHPIWRLGSSYIATGTPAMAVVGPTCLPGDLLSDDVHLESPAPGDVLVLGNAGAYGYSMSMLRWGSLTEVVQVVM